MSPAAAVRIARRLRADLQDLRFGPPVRCVYNPIEYAWDPHRMYLERFGTAPKKALFLGMNPGPWGMAQTGVPFGEVGAVRDWMGIVGPVGRPKVLHPRRPVAGFGCLRREVSGLRLWGWAKERFGTADRFFERCFVWNYCPLMFIGKDGENLTPDKLPAAQREALQRACDEALRQLAAHLQPETVVGIGAFAEARAREALRGRNVRIGSVPHPSPANPAANKGWSDLADRALAPLGLL